MTSVADLRRDYAHATLSKGEVHPDPIRQFGVWFDQAIQAQVQEPNAMTLATADRQGRPSARVVLLKGFDPRGFTFFTNYESRKAREIAENPHGCLVFYWGELERQVRIEGRIDKVARADSELYFASRPRGSRLGAWCSPQSRVIPDRQDLERRLSEVERRFEGDPPRPVPLPDFWGGFRLVPWEVELWQGRTDRLHDRLRYRRDPASPADWRIERLAP